MKKILSMLLIISMAIVAFSSCDKADVPDTPAETVTEEKEPELISTLPDTDGKRAVIERARLLTSFKFTPLNDIPSHDSTGHITLEAGKEYSGLPYSSCETNNKFIGEGVSFETFFSALANPDSVIYTKDLYPSHNASTYYGMVCNGFVRFCLDIEEHYMTHIFHNISDLKKIAHFGEYTENDIELCDILLANSDGRNHVALITDILKNEAGEVVEIEVSESIRPTCVARRFTIEKFFTTFKVFSLYRHRHIDEIPPVSEEIKALFTSGIEKAKPAIAVDYGNKSNYMEGETTVISSFLEGKNVIEILKDGVLIEEIETDGYTKLERQLEHGYYEIKHRGGEEIVEFCVCAYETSYSYDKKITINAKPLVEDSELRNVYFTTPAAGDYSICYKVLTLIPSEKEKYSTKKPLPNWADGYKAAFKNKYGIWMTDFHPIEVN